jgi:hypothetical protein
MDISTQAEILLRRSGYETWLWTGTPPNVVCFENQAIIGFVHVFETANELVETWSTKQEMVLKRHAGALRSAGPKAWNVYSLFLTPDPSVTLLDQVQRIDEDFSLTRKLARAGVRTTEDLETALLPLIAIKSQPLLSEANFISRLRARLKDLPPAAVDAFLGSASADEVTRILGETS